MDNIEEVSTCPLGSSCTEIKDGKIYRCSWHIKIAGKDAAGNDHDEWGSAIPWTPIFLSGIDKATQGVSAAVESLRNETVTRQDKIIGLVEMPIIPRLVGDNNDS